MGIWTWSAEIGILFGVLTFALIFLPIIAFQYRRYGRFSGLRFIGAGAVSIYVTTLIAYTLLPLPSAGGVACEPKIQLVPFHFIADIAAETGGEGVLGTLTSRAALQVVFNVLLFVPLGVIVRGFFARGLVATVLAGAATSLFIELTQLTGIWGIYACPYRVADVDDLLANTLGAVAGALLGPLVLSWMPRQRVLRAARGTARPVTTWRRWLGMAIDWALFTALGTAFVVIYRLLLLAVAGDVPLEPGVLEAALGSLLPALLVFVLPALRSSGASLGQTAVWLVPKWSHPASVARRLLRALSVGGLYGLLVFVSQLPLPVSELAGSLASLLVLAAFIAVPLTPGKAGLSGAVTRAVMSDERDERNQQIEHAEPPAGR